MTLRRGLVVLRYPRGSGPPTADALQAALRADRDRLHLPAAGDLSYAVAGPYAIEVDGQPLDEWVAWES
jgi:hypothetical protein